MKFLAPLVLFALLFSACEKIEGQLNVTREFKLKNSKGDTHLIRVGTYSADIKPKTKDKITLRLNNDSDEKFIFRHEGNIPDNGTFTIPSSVSGQPVDLNGSVVTTVSNSEIRETVESCTYTEPVQVCYPAPQGGVNCTIQHRTVYGRQWIQYYDRQTFKNVHLNVMSSGSSLNSADFHGDIAYSDRIILRQSMCR